MPASPRRRRRRGPVAGPDEIDLTGDRVYLDLVVRGSGNAPAGQVIEADGKDGSLWALDLTGAVAAEGGSG